MVVLSGKSSVGNVIHLIIGPETEFWLDLHGAAITSLSDIVKSMDPAVPLFVSVTRCRNEAGLIDEIQTSLANGENYPFPLPTPSPEKPSANIGLPPPPTVGQEMPAKVDPGAILAAKPTGKKTRCTRCGSDRDIVPKLAPAICYSCVKIDMFLAKNARSAAAPDTEMT